MAADGQVPPWLDGIEGEELPKLILSNSPVIRVISGPGSGKTMALQRRVQRLVEEGADPARIFVGTFTRVIAHELVRSLGSDVQYRGDEEEQVGGVSVSTLHSLALRLLRSNPAAVGGREFRFLLGFETEALLYDLGEAITRLATQASRREVLNRLLAGWAEGRSLGDAEFEGELDRWLRRHGGMLVGEVVYLALRSLQSGDLERGIFDNVLIDEYQDLTLAEQDLVDLVWSQKGSLVVLGDDDQSIYGFRFNHPGGISEFPQRWQAVGVEDLAPYDNRRSHEPIVDLANTMMAQAGPTKPPMNSILGPGPQPNLLYWPNLDSEIDGLATYISQQIDRRFLVLVPRRFVGYRLRDKVGEDARTLFREEVLDLPLVCERFTMASLLANPDDSVALRAWLGFRRDEAFFAPGRNSVAYTGLLAQGRSGVDLIRGIADGEVEVAGEGRTHVEARARSLMGLLEKAPSQFAEKVDLTFDPEIAEAIDDPEKRDRAARDLSTLNSAAREVGEALESENLAEVMEALRYRIATGAPLVEEADARVRIMTLHGAKGLEADAVIVAGVADQMIPGIPLEDPEKDQRNRDEQRRLLYVSITRAREVLIISWPQRVRYSDARHNHVRVDASATRTEGGERIVQLTRSTLIPDLPFAPVPGEDWLSRQGGEA